ncbi:hypothetical protein [uncultured Dialister sp.]|nr:hypothetical protein [uncultured Dialister sp.]
MKSDNDLISASLVFLQEMIGVEEISKMGTGLRGLSGFFLGRDGRGF